MLYSTDIAACNSFIFPKLWFYLKGKILTWKTFFEKYNDAAWLNIKQRISGASTNEKLPGLSVLNVKGTSLKIYNISFIAHFCLG